MRLFGITVCLLLAAASLYGSRARVERKAQTKAQLLEAVKDFTQGFYSWYVPEALETEEAPAWSVALKYKRSVFSTALYRALKEDSDAQARESGEIVGLDFDPFLSTQDPCKRYEVGAVTSQGAVYRVDIYGTCLGRRDGKPDAVAEVTRQHGSWAFTNFLYPAAHGDLLDILKALREERRRPKSSR